MEQEEKTEVIPEELYAPLGDTTFKKTKKEVVPEYVSYKDVELRFAKKPFNGKKVFSFLAVFLILAFFCTAVFLYVKNKKQVYRQWLHKETKNYATVLFTTLDSKFLRLSEGNPFMTSILLDFKTSYDASIVTKEEKDFLDVLENTNASYTLGMDLKNKTFTHLLKTSYKGDNLFSVYGNGNESILSFLIREVTGKFLTLPNYFSFLLKNQKEEKKDIEQLRKWVVATLLSKVAEKDFTEEKVSLMIDGKEEKVRKVTLSLEKEKGKEILLKLCNQFLESKKGKEKLASYFALTEEQIEEYIHSIKNLDTVPIRIHLYAKEITNKVRKVEMEVQMKDTYFFEKQEGKREKWTLRKNEETLLDITRENTKIQGVILGNTVQLVKEGNSTYHYTLDANTDIYSGTIKINDTDLKLSKKGTLHFTMQHQNDQGEEISTIDLSMVYNTNTVDTLSLYQDENSLSYATLEKKVKEEMKEKIKKTEAVHEVATLVGKYIQKIGM